MKNIEKYKWKRNWNCKAGWMWEKEKNITIYAFYYGLCTQHSSRRVHRTHTADITEQKNKYLTSIVPITIKYRIRFDDSKRVDFWIYLFFTSSLFIPFNWILSASRTFFFRPAISSAIASMLLCACAFFLLNNKSDCVFTLVVHWLGYLWWKIKENMN